MVTSKSTILLGSLFVLFYGSGFVATQYGAPYADPASFLTLRFIITSTILALICWRMKPPLPRASMEWLHTIIAGVLIIGVFSLGVYISIDMGTSGATAALVISFQPLIASLLSMFIFGAKVTKAQWLGLVVGLGGIILVVFQGLDKVSWAGLGMSVVGLLGVACGSVYQKYFCPNMNLFSGGLIQTISSGIFCGLIWFAYPEKHIEWRFELIFAVLWMAIIVSIGAVSMLYLLIRRLEVTQVSTLFYLIPVSSVMLSLVFLRTSLSLVQAIGILIVALSVYLVTTLSAKSSV